MSRVIKDAVLQPIFEFIHPILGSPKWTDRYIAMIALGSIMEGPNPESTANIIAEAYSYILGMLDDPIPRVRQTVAFVYYKLAEFVPEIILCLP